MPIDVQRPERQGPGDPSAGTCDRKNVRPVDGLAHRRRHGVAAATDDEPARCLLDDEEPEAAEVLRTSVVAPARRTAESDPVHSFHTLLQDLATVCQHAVTPRRSGAEPFEIVTRPTQLQRKAFKLLPRAAAV